MERKVPFKFTITQQSPLAWDASLRIFNTSDLVESLGRTTSLMAG
jgi:hypothetical protein